MQVAGDLVRRAAGRRDVDEPQAADGERIHHLAAERAGDLGIVVAGHPDPAPVLLEDFQGGEIARRDALGGAAIVEAVAERHDDRLAHSDRWPTARRSSVSRVS